MAFIVPTSVSDGQVLTRDKWNQDVVENSSLLFYTTRLYQSSARTTNLTLSAGGANVYATGATFPAVSGSLYRMTAFFPSVSNSGTYVVFSVALSGAVTATIEAAKFDQKFQFAAVVDLWWTATATGNVTANLTSYGDNGFLEFLTGNDMRLRVSGPMLTV